VGSPINRIQDTTPTEQELWALAETEGFERGEAIMQIKPDPTQPYCAAVYGTLGLDEIHVGLFEAHASSDGKPWLRLEVLTETECPTLATCPPSLLNSVPSRSRFPGSLSNAWRKRCRDFDLMRKVSGGDSARQEVLRNLADNGRLVFSRIG
jgi:hypothetical protein